MVCREWQGLKKRTQVKSPATENCCLQDFVDIMLMLCPVYGDKNDNEW